MEVNISDLTWDRFIYPRGNKSDKTISSYVEALTIGAQFPPIRIQRVFNYAKGDQTTEVTIILDGIHRWFAFKESGIKKIPAVEWKDKPLDYEKNKVAFLLESAKCNTSHGDRLSPGDKKRIARDIAASDPARPPPARNASILHELALQFCSYEHNEKMYMASFNARQAGRSHPEDTDRPANAFAQARRAGM